MEGLKNEGEKGPSAADMIGGQGKPKPEATAAKEKPPAKPRKGKAAAEIERQPNVGDPCPNEDCKGKLGVQSGYSNGKHRVQYLFCRRCNAKPENNKRVTNV